MNMTNKTTDTATTAGKVKVMQAASAGKTVERLYRDGNSEWAELVTPIPDGFTWDWLNNDYRIKRAPREWWIYICPQTGLLRWVAYSDSIVPQGIHVREVLP